MKLPENADAHPNHTSKPRLTAGEIAELTGGELVGGSPDLEITGVASIFDALSGDATFLSMTSYQKHLADCEASLVIAPRDLDQELSGKAMVLVDNPTQAFGLLVAKFAPARRQFAPGVHPSAVIAENVSLDPSTVHVGPNAVIDEGAVIGDGCVIGAGVYIGSHCQLGKDCHIHPNAAILDRCILKDRVVLYTNATIGADGFGYTQKDGKHVKVEQVGIVQLDDDVEIGAGTTIDRARFGRTHIGEGSKIDNLCQIAHNVVIGKHSIVVAMSGIAGSTRIGDYVTIAAQVGISGHLTLVDKVMVLGGCTVSRDILEPGVYYGDPSPAGPLMETKRHLAGVRRAPKKIKELEKRIAELEAKLQG